MQINKHCNQLTTDLSRRKKQAEIHEHSIRKVEQLKIQLDNINLSLENTG